MKKELIVRLHQNFEQILQISEDEEIEFCYARDLQKLLEYSQWRNFEALIEKAITSCENAGYDAANHFAKVRKMVPLGSGAMREMVSDFQVTNQRTLDDVLA